MVLQGTIIKNRKGSACLQVDQGPDHIIMLIGFKVIAYNPMVISNILSGERPRRIKSIVSC